MTEDDKELSVGSFAESDSKPKEIISPEASTVQPCNKDLPATTYILRT